MNRLLAVVTTLVALTPLLVGCSSRNNPEQYILRIGEGMSDVFQGTHHDRSKPIHLEAGAPLALDVETFNGDVTVLANARASRATVVITRESTFGHLGGRARKEALDAVAATVELVPGDLGPALRVRTVSDDSQPHFQRAHVWIEVPEVEGVRVRTGTGRIDVRRASGRVDLESHRGSVLFATPAAITQDVAIATSDGDVDFRIGAGSTGVFDVESVGGRVRQRVTAGRWIATDVANTHGRVRARLSGGANTIVLRAAEGDIRVAVVDDPMAFGLKIVDP